MEVRTPGSNVPRDPYEDLKAERIEKDKEEKDKAKAKNGAKKPAIAFLIWIQMMLFFSKIASLFSNPKKEKKNQNVNESLLIHIEKVKDCLERLKTIDFNQDIQYLNYFSKSWHEFLEAAANVKRDVRYYRDLENFIRDIQEYPSGQEHSLGYYLAEFAGSEWLPFPFMELLSKLHHGHISSPHNSDLKKWTDALKDLMIYIRGQS